MEELEAWEFVRTSSDEEERIARWNRTRTAIDRARGQRDLAHGILRRAPGPLITAIVGPVVVASCPTAQRVRAENDSKRAAGIHVKGDPGSSGKRAYTQVDARADRKRAAR